jgi:EpsI family protein
LGHISRSRIIVVVICFILAAAFVYREPEVRIAQKEKTLAEALANIEGWKNSGLVQIDTRIVDVLNLDDYVNNYFANSEGVVSLYIGYYLSSQKVSAAHSPLVCFPGQGWDLSDFEEKSVKVGDHTVNLRRIIATAPDRKELLIYWFQSYEKTSPDEFFQKIYTLLAKFVDGREDNAFVRVTVPMKNMDVDQAYKIGVDFIKAFYPHFLKHIKADKLT